MVESIIGILADRPALAAATLSESGSSLVPPAGAEGADFPLRSPIGSRPPLAREAAQSVVGDGLEVDRVEQLIERPVDERIADTDACRSQIKERVGRAGR